VIGLAQEWSTLVLPVNIKVAVGFLVMILVLILRPQGIFGRARSVER
jgi:branched-subunit amino acid ABC-type transport system permease component